MLVTLGFGQSILTSRYDGQGPVMSGYTLGYDDPTGISVWGLGIDTPYPEYDAGFLKQVYGTKNAWVLAGGYAAVWPTTRQWFAEPWLIGNLSSGKLTVHMNLAGFVPLNKGPFVLASNDTSVIYQVSSRLRVGLQATLWNQEQAAPTLRYGPRVILSVSKNAELSVSTLILGSKQADIRVVETIRF